MSAQSAPATEPKTVTVEAPSDAVAEETTAIRAIPIEKLRIDHSYQRSLTRKADEMGKNWREDLVGVLIVSERDASADEWYVVDGQNRLHAANIAGKMELMCDIRTGLSIKEEAKLFDDTNMGRTHVTAIDRFRARLVYEDRVAMDIQRIMHMFDGEIAQRTGRVDKNDTAVRAVAALERVYRALGPLGLETILSVLKDSWDSIDFDTTNEFTLGGLRAFIQRQPKADRDRLTRRMREEGFGQLRRMAHAHASIFGGSASVNWYRSLVEVYNKGLQSNRLSP